MQELLTSIYNIIKEEATVLSDFLLLTLNIYPEKRANALELLNHPWLKVNTESIFDEKKN